MRVPNFVDNVAVLTYLKYQHSPPSQQLTAGAGGPIGAWQVPSLSPGPTQRQVPGSVEEGMGYVFYKWGMRLDVKGLTDASRYKASVQVGGGRHSAGPAP